MTAVKAEVFRSNKQRLCVCLWEREIRWCKAKTELVQTLQPAHGQALW